MAENGGFDVIIHGCNCFNAMGAGIARQIAIRFPEARDVDSATLRGSTEKLGKITAAKIGDLLVGNAYTQYGISNGTDVFEYGALRSALYEVVVALKKIGADPKNARIGSPMIGCGLARGDPERIIKIIFDWSTNLDVTIVTLPEN